MNMLRIHPTVALSYARTFACLSAANIEPSPNGNTDSTLFKLLHQRIYIPETLNPQHDCLVYVPIQDGRFYIPSWARAGVRYIRPNIDILQLVPRDWFVTWYDHYSAAQPDPDIESQIHKDFLMMFESMGENEDAIEQALLNNNVLIDNRKIRAALERR